MSGATKVGFAMLGSERTTLVPTVCVQLKLAILPSLSVPLPLRLTVLRPRIDWLTPASAVGVALTGLTLILTESEALAAALSVTVN